MNENEKILSGIFYSNTLTGLDETIKKWDFESVNGIGFIRGINGKYAHIELEITKPTDYPNINKIVYKVSENQLPKEYRIEIERTLSFFISYLNSLKTDEIQLVFCITDATYHPVDSRPIDFQNAIMKALASCFGKTFRPISDVDRKIINNCKEYSLKTGYNNGYK